MNSKLVQTLTSGVAGTAVMSLVNLYVLPFIGLPVLDAAGMLAGLADVSRFGGWITHFLIGCIFAASYVYWLGSKLKMSSNYLKGALFGFGVFVFAQIAIGAMSAIMDMPEPSSGLMAIMIASLIGHIFYGIVVVLMVKN